MKLQFFDGQVLVNNWHFQVIQVNILSIRKANIGTNCDRESVRFLLLKIIDKRLDSDLS